MNKVIILTGNIASGKSTAHKIIQQITGFELICIDRVRVELYKQGLSGFELERAAEKQCLEMIGDGSYIYESTGTTQFYKRMIREGFCKHDKTYIHLNTDPDLCEYRFRVRKEDHFQVAPPYNGMSVKQSIRKNNGEYRRMAFDHVISNNAPKIHLVKEIHDLPWTLILK